MRFSGEEFSSTRSKKLSDFFAEDLSSNLKFFLSFRIEMSIQPEPIPTSNKFILSLFFVNLKTSSIKTSVSGLGIKTSLFTKKLLMSMIIYFGEII